MELRRKSKVTTNYLRFTIFQQLLQTTKNFTHSCTSCLSFRNFFDDINQQICFFTIYDYSWGFRLTSHGISPFILHYTWNSWKSKMIKQTTLVFENAFIFVILTELLDHPNDKSIQSGISRKGRDLPIADQSGHAYWRKSNQRRSCFLTTITLPIGWVFRHCNLRNTDTTLRLTPLLIFRSLLIMTLSVWSARWIRKKITTKSFSF